MIKLHWLFQEPFENKPNRTYSLKLLKQTGREKSKQLINN